ncbi:hypothetical protein NUACC21_74850 [Scytonema sp. NUACC21]
MESDNNRETSDRQPTYQSDRKLSDFQQSAWDSLEQSRRDLDSAFGAIEELARTLEAFESRRRKRSQHELAVGETESIPRTEEVSENRIDGRTITPVKFVDVTGQRRNRTAKDKNTHNPNDDNGGGSEDTREDRLDGRKADGVDIPDISPTEQAKPTRIVRQQRGLEL